MNDKGLYKIQNKSAKKLSGDLRAKHKALKEKTSQHSWLDKHVSEQAKRHGPVISKLIKDVSK